MDYLLPSLATLVAVISAFLISLAPIATSLIERSKVDSDFIDDIKKGLIANNLTYEDLQHIAEYHHQDRKAILYTLRAMLSESVRGEEKLTEITPYIRDLLEEHQNKEPFAELPENISLQLSDIRTDGNDKKINQLAASLSTIYSTNQRESEKEKILSTAGFLIGAIGVVLTIAFFFLASK